MINVKPVKASSETHNNRLKDYDYVLSELTPQNENWTGQSISSMQKEIARYCKEKSGRKLQKNATPIREAVVLLRPNHSMNDLKKLANDIKDEFGVECFQIHIHKDEGHFQNKEQKVGWTPNLHAHLVFRWQDMETGKTKRLNKADMSKLQTLVANSLSMDRGEFKTNSNRERLEPTAYKEKLAQQNYDKLQEQLVDLEQKKNTVRARIEKLERERAETSKEAFRDTFSEKWDRLSRNPQEALRYSENDLIDAIIGVTKQIDSIENN